MSRPVVGIATAIEEVSWGAWTALSNVSPRSYSLAVQAAGGLALLLAADDAAAERPGELLDRLDALLLSGGADMDPASYGARPHAETRGTRPERDRFELALAHEALERELPLLGICRGMEVLNVARGGTLVQHLPDELGSERHRHTPGAFADHEVRLAAGTLAERAVGAERTTVKSHHHQGVGELGEDVSASGWAVEDDLVEAIELPANPYALGVLWHPEADERSRAIGSLVEAARTRRG